jgi:hypothetical protein
MARIQGPFYIYLYIKAVYIYISKPWMAAPRTAMTDRRRCPWVNGRGTWYYKLISLFKYPQPILFTSFRSKKTVPLRRLTL